MSSFVPRSHGKIAACRMRPGASGRLSSVTITMLSCTSIARVARCRASKSQELAQRRGGEPSRHPRSSARCAAPLWQGNLFLLCALMIATAIASFSLVPPPNPLQPAQIHAPAQVSRHRRRVAIRRRPSHSAQLPDHHRHLGLDRALPPVLRLRRHRRRVPTSPTSTSSWRTRRAPRRAASTTWSSSRATTPPTTRRRPRRPARTRRRGRGRGRGRARSARSKSARSTPRRARSSHGSRTARALRLRDFEVGASRAAIAATHRRAAAPSIRPVCSPTIAWARPISSSDKRSLT